ncbi:uncharacterized protein LOC117104526 [Anneissia japonica]|uniref:uncharacterized protein LOC117104526 n=1 Tax=Anneissia japonica TaxID=1529436 RepID=UPI00142561CD|nr:uncharacterized protein LOC117104526 [Anneissia japonica]
MFSIKALWLLLLATVGRSAGNNNCCPTGYFYHYYLNKVMCREGNWPIFYFTGNRNLVGSHCNINAECCKCDDPLSSCYNDEPCMSLKQCQGGNENCCPTGYFYHYYLNKIMCREGNWPIFYFTGDRNLVGSHCNINVECCKCDDPSSSCYNDEPCMSLKQCQGVYVEAVGATVVARTLNIEVGGSKPSLSSGKTVYVRLSLSTQE